VDGTGESAYELPERILFGSLAILEGHGIQVNLRENIYLKAEAQMASRDVRYDPPDG